MMQNEQNIVKTNIKKDLEQAQTALFYIKMIQDMAIGNEAPNNVADYASLINEFLPKIGSSLESIEKNLYSLE